MERGGGHMINTLIHSESSAVFALIAVIAFFATLAAYDQSPARIIALFAAAMYLTALVYTAFQKKS